MHRDGSYYGALINAEGVQFTQVFPCFEHQTLADLLAALAISWRYYGVLTSGDPGENGIWLAPLAIKHICVASGRKCTGAAWTSNVDTNPYSDHMGHVNVTGGPSWVASIVNAVGSSPCKNPDGSSYWSSTAIIVTWDDWGGWYDHERPTIEAPPQGGYQMGFRVPLIVVSAYTPVGFISNTPEDFGSVARFVERNFGLMEGALTFADLRSSTDLTEFFSLGNTPRAFQPIKAPLSAQHFLSAKPSGLAPDDD
jgi:Phosphoesterase family